MIFISGSTKIRNYFAKKKLLQNGWTPPLLNESRETAPASPKILHLLYSSLPYLLNGYSIRSHAILRSQQQLGLSVLAVSRPGFPWDMPQCQLPEQAQISHHEQLDGIAYQRIADPGRGISEVTLDAYLDRYCRHLDRIVAEERPRLLHAASNFVNGCAAGAVGRNRHIPVVYEVRGFWEMTLSSLKPRRSKSLLVACHQRLETQALEMADAVVCLSAGLQREIVQRGIPADKVHVIPNGVDCHTFVPRPKDQALLARLGLADKVVVGYVGSLVEYEGIDTLIRAGAWLEQQGVPIRILIVGDGTAKPQLMDVARRCRVENIVSFIGRIPHTEVLAYYSVLDICVFPRKNVAICHIVPPLKPYEAMAMGKAVVVSDVAALREMVEEGQTGLVCKADDRQALAAQIRRLVEDRGLRARLGEASRAWVQTHRDWLMLAPRYLSVYEAAERAARWERGGRVAGLSQ